MIAWRGLRDEWLMLALALLAAIAALASGHEQTGEPIGVELGVVPLDAVQLACAGPGCAFDQTQKPTAVLLPMRPFVTVGGQLIVMSGVFESVKVKAWLDTAPEKGATLHCPAVVLTRSAQFGVRFGATDAFATREVAVLSASECEVR